MCPNVNIEKMIETIDYHTHLAKVTLRGVRNRHGVAADVFSALGQHGLNVELITTCAVSRKRADISFAVLEANVDDVCRVLDIIKHKFGTRKMEIEHEYALITIYGSMLGNTPGIAGKIFSKLSERKINVDMINASISALSIVVSRERVMEAVGAIRAEFGV